MESYVRDVLCSTLRKGDIVIGNTPDIRKAYYALGMTRDEIAGWSRRSSGGAFVPVAQNCATKSATLLTESPSFWDIIDTMIEGGSCWKEVVTAALNWIGYSEEKARIITAHDRYAYNFYKDLTSCRTKVWEYYKQQITIVLVDNCFLV